MNNQEIDRQIAEKVMGWVAHGFKLHAGANAKRVPIAASDMAFYYSGNKRHCNIETFRPSTNIAHAFEVRDKIMEMSVKIRLDFISALISIVEIRVGKQIVGRMVMLHVNTEDICLAALEAVKGK